MRTILLVLAAFVLASCGAAPRDSAEDFSGAEGEVAAAVEGLEDAARANDPQRVCTKLLSDALLTALKEQGTNCTTAVKEAFRDASSKDLTVEEVTISGAKATAKVTSGSGSKAKSDTLELEKVGANWRIGSLTS